MILHFHRYMFHRIPLTSSIEITLTTIIANSTPAVYWFRTLKDLERNGHINIKTHFIRKLKKRQIINLKRIFCDNKEVDLLNRPQHDTNVAILFPKGEYVFILILSFVNSGIRFWCVTFLKKDALLFYVRGFLWLSIFPRISLEYQNWVYNHRTPGKHNSRFVFFKFYVLEEFQWCCPLNNVNLILPKMDR